MGYSNGYDSGWDDALNAMPMTDPRVQRFLKKHCGGDPDPSDPTVRALIDAALAGVDVINLTPYSGSIPSGAFQQAAFLSDVSLPGVTELGSNAFQRSSVTKFSAKSLTSPGASSLAYCTSLVSASLPSVVTMSADRVFEGCSALKDVSLPNATTVGGYAFYKCSGLVVLRLPKAVSIGIHALEAMTALTDLYVESMTQEQFDAQKSNWGLKAGVRVHLKGTDGRSAVYTFTEEDEAGNIEPETDE